MKMYKRILLAYDGSVEGRTALREGALLAKQLRADVFLLSVLADTGAFVRRSRLAGATVQIEERFQEILDEGIDRLKNLASIQSPSLCEGSPRKKLESSPEKSMPISSSSVTGDRAPLIAGGLGRRAHT